MWQRVGRPSLPANGRLPSALGVDGAEDMIAKAQRIDPRGDYVCADL